MHNFSKAQNFHEILHYIKVFVTKKIGHNKRQRTNTKELVTKIQKSTILIKQWAKLLVKMSSIFQFRNTSSNTKGPIICKIRKLNLIFSGNWTYIVE